MKLQDVLAVSAACTIAACTAVSVSPQLPQTSAALTPPQPQALLFVTYASGVQNYECASGKSGTEWVFKGPEAELADKAGRVLGKHYGGPTWESTDGSKVVGQVVSSEDAPDRSAIPHLLLSARSNSGDGVFAKVRSVQRLETVGGRAPSASCRADEMGRRLPVPYTATYYFYG